MTDPTPAYEPERTLQSAFIYSPKTRAIAQEGVNGRNYERTSLKSFELLELRVLKLLTGRILINSLTGTISHLGTIIFINVFRQMFWSRGQILAPRIGIFTLKGGNFQGKTKLTELSL